nr:FlgD Ig-like domain protein [uncultured bacterium]
MRKSVMVLAAAVALLGAGCPTDEDTEEEVCEAFCGTWTGGESSGAQSSGSMTFSVTGTSLDGDVAPISGSVRHLIGTVSATGAITASLAASGSNACAVNLSGQITTNNDASETATGTYTLVQSSTCNTNNGTWTATKFAGPD